MPPPMTDALHIPDLTEIAAGPYHRFVNPADKPPSCWGDYLGNGTGACGQRPTTSIGLCTEHAERIGIALHPH